MVFPVVMYGCELDYKESWVPKNWCFWTVVLEKTCESLGLQGEPTSPISHWKDWCWSWNSKTLTTWCEELTHLKRLWCWKDWEQEKKGRTEDEMVGWHHRLNGHGFGWTPGVGDGQEGLACCSSWGHKESDMTELLNWTEGYIAPLQDLKKERSLLWTEMCPPPRSLAGYSL